MAEAKSTKQIDWNDPSVIRYHTQKMKPKTVAQARNNMIKYLKNQGNYKIRDFKGMSYDEIRPIFEKGNHQGRGQRWKEDAEIGRTQRISRYNYLREEVPYEAHLLEELYRLVKEKYSASRLEGLAIHMLTKKKYPLSQELLSKMLSKKLKVYHESSQEFELLRIDQGVGSTSGIRACALRNFDLGTMELENSQNNALAKLPMLKLGEYEMWEIRIKQYFQIQDYALWEMTVPSTAEEKISKKNDVVGP
ncbi:hypothetical protein Tco_0369886 [Tanacetum coccineum]